MCGLYDISVAKFGQTNNLITQASNFGDAREVYSGFDVSVNARLRRGVLISGGTSTGHTVIGQLLRGGFAAAAVELQGRAADADAAQRLRRLSAAVGRAADERVVPEHSRARKSRRATRPPTPRSSPSLGRNLASCGAAATCTGTATVPLIAPGTMYGERLNQVDFRLSKSLKVGRSRVQAMLDLFNVFNGSPVLSLNNTFGAAWQRPQSILQGRLVKFGGQIDF